MNYDIDYDINGPINFFRLEHNEKIIYIYLDMSIDYNYLTDCSLISNPLTKSIDIDKYLINFLNNIKQNIDFFLYFNIKKEKSITNKREIYINQVNKLPKKVNKKNINFIYKKDKNKYIEKLYYIADKYNTFSTIYNYDIDYVIFDMKKILKYIRKISKIKVIFKFKIKIKKNINKLINLLKTNKINLIYGKNEKQFFELQSKIYNLLFIITNSIYLINITLDNTSNVSSILKNNNKSIIYFPCYSGLNLMHILLKFFNFKITDRFFSDPFIDKESIKELNKIIKNLEMDYESLLFMEKIFIYKNKDNNIIQCIKSFPTLM